MRSKERKIQKLGMVGAFVVTGIISACNDSSPSNIEIAKALPYPEPKVQPSETPTASATQTPNPRHYYELIKPPRSVPTVDLSNPTPPTEEIIDIESLKDNLRETQNIQQEYSDVFYEEVRKWTSLVRDIADEQGVDERLILAVIQGESAGDPNGIGGLMQVTSIHFEEGEDPNDPKTNITRGTQLLKNQLDFANSYEVPNPIEIALAGYGGGDLARDWKMGEITEEEFVAKLTERFITYHEMEAEEAGKMAGNHVLIINGAIATRMDWYRRAENSEAQNSLN